MLPVLVVVHLLVRGFILCADCTILFLLHRRHVRQNLISGPNRTGQRRVSQQGSTAIMILKLILDVAVLLLIVVSIHTFGAPIGKTPMTITEYRGLLGVRFDVAINLCFRFSMICISALELLILWFAFRNVDNKGFIWLWHKFAPLLLFVLTIMKLIPLIRLHDIRLQFWTGTGASSADFLSFGLIYSWLTVKLHLKHNISRKRILLQCAILCFSAAVLQLTALVVGLKLPFLQFLLLEISLLIITASSALRLAWGGQSFDTRGRQKRTQGPNTSVDDAHNRDFNLLQTVRSKAKTNEDSEDAKALYANARWTMDELDEPLPPNDARAGSSTILSNSAPSLGCNFCPRGQHQDMHRIAQESVSRDEGSISTVNRLLEKWPHMAGNGEQAWLRHLLEREKVENMHPEVDTSSVAEAKDIHHWAI